MIYEKNYMPLKNILKFKKEKRILKYLKKEKKGYLNNLKKKKK